MFISKKEYNKQLNETFLKGYELGKKTAYDDKLFENVTPNQIRAAFGFGPINKKKKWKSKNN